MKDRACKKCGTLESLGAAFRVSVIKGRTVPRAVCRKCETRQRREREQGEFGAEAVVLGDVHHPFMNWSAFAKVLVRVKAIRPRRIIQVGDLLDRLSASKFPRNLSIITPEEEFERGREDAVKMWAQLREASPRSECYQLFGNHDARPLKRVLEKAPELLPEVSRSVRGMHEFEGVTSIMSQNEELILDDVVYIHGSKTKEGAHAHYNGRSTVLGHTHRGWTWFRADGRGTIWELNAGCLVDEKHPAFNYKDQVKLRGVTLGFGIVYKSGPVFELI